MRRRRRHVPTRAVLHVCDLCNLEEADVLATDARSLLSPSDAATGSNREDEAEDSVSGFDSCASDNLRQRTRTAPLGFFSAAAKSFPTSGMESLPPLEMTRMTGGSFAPSSFSTVYFAVSFSLDRVVALMIWELFHCRGGSNRTIQQSRIKPRLGSFSWAVKGQ